MKLRLPDRLSIYTEAGHENFDGAPVVKNADAEVRLELGDALSVFVTADKAPLTYLKLRWNLKPEEKRTGEVKVLGDSWERAYGDLEWHSINPDRCLQFYFFVSNGTDTNRSYAGRYTEAFGVKVQTGSMCFWNYDGDAVTLWMDVRCGGDGVILDGRTLHAADVVLGDYRDMSAYDAASDFCHVMSPNTLVPPHKVYGFNNWYYAYGNSSHEQIIRDASLAAELCRGLDNPPYMVVDDGWQPNACDGPWDRGNERFPDLAKLASEIKALGVRPGIWVRLLADKGLTQFDTVPKEQRNMRDERFFDPSHPEVLRHVYNDVKRCVDWGYMLVKQDFSCMDFFGSRSPDKVTKDGWHFYDRSKTSAEIIVNFYRTIKEAAGDAVVIGCNAVTHLCAGLCELNRTGDDTSGRYWSRTRNRGVNAVAFHGVQNGAFYTCDADCVGILPDRIPWEFNRKWLDMVAKSGTPLFVSCDPDAATDEVKADLREAFKINSVQENKLVPLDWMENVCPRRWLFDGVEKEIDWYGIDGREDFGPIKY